MIKKNVFKKTVKYGFWFFLIKGLLWLFVPVLIYLYSELFGTE